MTEAQQPSVRTERSGHVLVVTIDRPQARNAINADVAGRLADALETADADPEIRCIVLTGEGDRAFCAGADLKALARGETPLPTGREHYGFAGFVQHPISTPIVAAVNGAAQGGGTELVLASDIAVAADTATFGLPEIARGLFAAAGGVLRLPEQLPRKVAMKLILTGEVMSAHDAQRWGLINDVVPVADLLPAALALAETIAANAPLAVQASKRLALGIVDGDLPHEAEAWARNQSEIGTIGASADAQEGIAAFIERRAPVWQAR